MKIYLLLIISIFISCSTNKAVVKTSIEEIRFGSGGGFTGRVITYALNSNGKLTEGVKDLKQIDSKNTLLLLKDAQKLNGYYFNEPENIYSFIEIHSKDTTNKIIWNLGSTKLNKSVLELYNKLMSLNK